MNAMIIVEVCRLVIFGKSMFDSELFAVPAKR